MSILPPPSNRVIKRRSFLSSIGSALPEGRLGVGLRHPQQRRLRRGHVSLGADPRLQARRLQRSAVRKRKRPRILFHIGSSFVHEVQVRGGVILALPAREEEDTRDRRRARPSKRGDRRVRHLTPRRLRSVAAARHHVGLEDHALEHHLVLHERREHRVEHALGHLRALLDAVRAVRQDLRLDDGHEAVLLADGGVPRQAFGVVVEALDRRQGVSDGEHRAPLGEPRAARVVPRAPLAEAVQPLRRGLASRVARKRHHAFVHLDARYDRFGVEEIHEGCAVAAGLA
mmetsp:Transcript_9116/g.41379  ORF Transcript_9116/g.41379 Transcript_9116/m.41379 type:complete len:286 (+) Transcript_9116:765-1622(+)